MRVEKPTPKLPSVRTLKFYCPECKRYFKTDAWTNEAIKYSQLFCPFCGKQKLERKEKFA